MSRKIYFPLLLLIGFLFLPSCRVTPPTVSPDLPLLDLESISRCEEHADCVLVLPACCGNYTAINQEHLDAWDSYQGAKKLTCPMIVCEPLLPADLFAARCIESTCTVRDASCEEEIKDPAFYQDLIRRHPYVTQLEAEFNLLEVQLPDPCIMAGRVQAVLRYEIPKGFSSGVVYMADVKVWLRLEDDRLDPAYDPEYEPTAGPLEITPEYVRDYFMDRTRQLESEPRIAELLEKAGWDSTMGRVYLSTSPVRIQFQRAFIEYAYPYNNPAGGVYQYVVPNGLELETFPEISLAHAIIQEQLLTGKWSHCSINKQGWAYNNTTGYRFLETSETWSLDVDLECDGEWKIANIKLNPDGSYERLEVH